MTCMCLPKMKGFLASLKNMLLNELLGLLPELPDLNAVVTLAAGQGAISAMSSMSAQLSAALKLGGGLPSLSASSRPRVAEAANLAGLSGANFWQKSLRQKHTPAGIFLPWIFLP